MNRMYMKKYIWRTRKLVRQTKDALTIYFDVGQHKIHYLPGQYLNIKLTIRSEIIIRPYSFCSVPSDPYPAITVKRVEGGVVSNYIVDNASIIEYWAIEGPFGNFVLDSHVIDQQPIVLLAGGSGISPLFAMLRSAYTKTSIPILFYSNKTPEDTIFFNELTDLEEARELQTYYSFTAPEYVPQKNNQLGGRFSVPILQSLIKKFVPTLKAHFYICGPMALMELYQNVLKNLRIPEKNIHFEHFHPAPQNAALQQTGDTIKDVLVRYYDQVCHNDKIVTFECTSLISVKPGESLLDALRGNNIKVSSTCNNGTCGSCWAVRTEGEVHMLRHDALTPLDLNSGVVLLCQSYPINDKVSVTLQ
ncbi:3-ketosteroid-9-alpha-hydroxylase reductase subunit [Sphingobacterium thalpophilum]|uniref:3-ketosteroid-9-alpha-hydroxylase reductase subunit n=2 Tax=Sphingobacterium thalpophilum TaxID=259 RepID=A0A4U9VZF3_9SPHI|nr:3-ketosteroid-9-alpha-hydroxylase reductase subunit [Sphingobacterium thalpophilum]